LRKLFLAKKSDGDVASTATAATTPAQSSGVNGTFAMLWKGFEAFVDGDKASQKVMG